MKKLKVKLIPLTKRREVTLPVKRWRTKEKALAWNYV